MKISENQLSWKSDTFCRSENAPVIKNKSGIKYEARNSGDKWNIQSKLH